MAAVIQPYEEDAPPPAPPQVGDNFEAANTDLKMTRQEQDLYQRHLGNLYGPGGVDNANGSRSTLYQTSVEMGGKFYNLPTVYDGKIVTPDEAVDRARAQGLSKFPAYSTQKEAEDRYQQMHDYMDRDTARFLGMRNQFRAQATMQAFGVGTGTGVTY